MKNVIFIIIILLLIISARLSGQESEFATWNTFKIETKVKKWELSAETELRYSISNDHLKRSGVELSASYPVIKKIRLGVAYNLMDYYDLKYSDFQLRHRYSFFVTGKKRWGDVQFSLSEKVQSTLKDDSDRIKSSGEIDTYATNPEWTWRNKLKIDYNIPGCKIKPSIAAESFFSLNDPDGNKFSGLRYSLSLGYKLNKHHKIELNGILDQDVNSTKNRTTYIPGISYTISF
jgi:hypothetical protein